MKVIDVLNKIANGEEVPKKIKYLIYEYTYNDEDEEYQRNKNGNIIGLGEEWKLDRALCDEVEVIEEKEMCHKCGKYPSEYNQTYCEFCLGISEEDKKIEKIDSIDYWHSTDTSKDMVLVEKINEIIDKVNKGE